MTTPHAPTDPPRDPLAALGLTTLGTPGMRDHLALLFAGAGLTELTDAIRVIFAASRTQSERPGDFYDTLARGLDGVLTRTDMLWPCGSELARLAAANGGV